MKFLPMLARSLDIKTLPTYASNPSWHMEQKLDGKRVLIKVEDGVVTAANRKGETIGLDQDTTDLFSGFAGSWCFDGEELNGTFWIFDMPYALNLVTVATPYDERRRALEAVCTTAWGEGHSDVRLIDVARTVQQKKNLITWCAENAAEGIMIKARSGIYEPGKRSYAMFKAKFVSTVDCVIIEPRREGKLSSSVGLYHNGALTDCGSVKMSEEQLQQAHPGDCVEVRYLYCTVGRRLYQPVFLGFRPDKDAEECTFEQITRYVNKEVRISDKNSR